MPWSDLNVVVTFRTRSLSEKEVLKQVERFQGYLSKQTDFVSESEFGERKNISILKFRVSPNFAGKRVEVIFRRAMAQNLPKNESIITGYLETYPISRDLYLLVRRVLHSADLDNPVDGGINTLASFLLVIAFIQKIESSTSQTDSPFPKAVIDNAHSVDVTTCGDLQSTFSEFGQQRVATSLHNYLNLQKLGETFLNLLYFYGHMFDYTANFIRPYVSRFSKSHPFSVKTDNCINSLMILNPFDHNLIITKSFKKTSNLKSTFKLLYNHHFSTCSCSSTPMDCSLPKLLSSQPVLRRVSYVQDDDQWYSREALILSIPAQSVPSQSDLTETVRSSKGRSRLSSKSNVFVTLSTGIKRTPEFDAATFPSSAKLQAMLAYNFQ